jgi:hypothetical protein
LGGWPSPGIPELLKRWPPSGWIGAGCNVSGIISRADNIAVALQEAYAYPIGVELWLRFITAPAMDAALRDALKGHLAGLVLPAEISRAMPPDLRSEVEALKDPEAHPKIRLATPTGEEWSLRRPTDGGPGSGLFDVGRVGLGLGSHLLVMWLRALPTKLTSLELVVSWPAAGLPEGRLPLDVKALRDGAKRARRLLLVDATQGSDPASQ